MEFEEGHGEVCVEERVGGIMLNSADNMLVGNTIILRR